MSKEVFGTWFSIVVCLQESLSTMVYLRWYFWHIFLLVMYFHWVQLCLLEYIYLQHIQWLCVFFFSFSDPHEICSLPEVSSFQIQTVSLLFWYTCSIDRPAYVKTIKQKQRLTFVCTLHWTSVLHIPQFGNRWQQIIKVVQCVYVCGVFITN